jgi:dihydrofolate synthase/folylpolyglutamate synthase
MDFDDAVRYVRGRLRLGVKLGNDRFLALLERLGNPQELLEVVHIAGTKGKGSTAVMAASILQAAGYRTGTYLSPYVYDVRERIQIDGAMIPREDFARWVTTIKPHVDALEATDFGPTTEFELKTAIGFCYFAEQKVDYAVVEVGLGGRLDATNVFNAPLVTGITTIGYDHVELLGPTLADIAREKAGIIKPGIPCVTAVPAGSEADCSISAICRERGAPLVRVARAGTNAEITYGASDEGSLNVRTSLRKLDGVRMRLRGSFQHGNAATALGMLDSIAEDRRPRITDEQARRGLEEAYLPARLDHVASNPVVVVDGAHNELAAQALATALREEDLLPRGVGHESPRRLILVVGMSRNHAPASFLDPLLALRPAAVIATQPEFHPRESREVAAVAADAKVDIVRVVDTSVADACREALSIATPNDVICLTGSFYTAGDVSLETWRKLLEERK